MKGIGLIPFCKTDNPEIAEWWAKICNEQERQYQNWFWQLRAEGIVGAHPDDGWVNRDTNEVQFVYPHFDDGIGVGALVALGWPDKWRTIRLVGKRVTIFDMEHYKFVVEAKP